MCQQCRDNDSAAQLKTIGRILNAKSDELLRAGGVGAAADFLIIAINKVIEAGYGLAFGVKGLSIGLIVHKPGTDDGRPVLMSTPAETMEVMAMLHAEIDDRDAEIAKLDEVTKKAKEFRETQVNAEDGTEYRETDKVVDDEIPKSEPVKTEDAA